MCENEEINTGIGEALPIVDNEDEISKNALEELSNGIEDGEGVNNDDLHEQ